MQYLNFYILLLVLNINIFAAITDADFTIENNKSLQLRDVANDNEISIQSPATLTSNITLTLPNNTGNIGEFLTTDGSGNLDWKSVVLSDNQTLTATLNNSILSLKISGGNDTHIDLANINTDHQTITYTIENNKLFLTITNGGVISIPLSDLNNNNAIWGNITGTLSTQTDLQNILNTKFNTSDIIDTLTATHTNKALSANQGRVLKGLVDTKANSSSLQTVATTGDYNDLSNKPDLTVYDDVEQFANQSGFPATGNPSKFYLAQDSGLMYRWSGATYVNISAQLALGETLSTAYRGDRGKVAYDHTFLTNNPHSITKEQVGLAHVNNTSDANKPISNATQSALDNKEDDLNNPSSNGQILASTTNGVRSWIDAPNSAIWGNITGTLSTQTDLQNILNTKFNTSDIIDTLTATHTNKALSANQGRVLKGLVDTKANSSSLQTVATTGDYNDLSNKPDLTLSLSNDTITIASGNSIDVSSVDNQTITHTVNNNTLTLTIANGNTSNVDLSSFSKNIHQLSGRIYLNTDNRWVRTSNTSYGLNNHNFSQNAGKNTNPNISWNEFGFMFPANAKLKNIIIIARANNTEVSDVEFQFVAVKPNPVSRWESGIDNNNEITTTTILSDSFFNSSIAGQPAFSGRVNDIHKREYSVNYTDSEFSQIHFYARPVGTLTSRRYFYVNVLYEYEL